MANSERRDSPRTPCTVPVRFRILAKSLSFVGEEPLAPKGSIHSATMEGEALNLSEFGIYFKSRENLKVGEELEMYLTLPRDFTGRGGEQVRCSARVVRAEERANAQGVRGFGARIERFEPIAVKRNWDN
jgi:hypothetical protein